MLEVEIEGKEGGESFITRHCRPSSSSWRGRGHLLSSGARRSACSILMGPTRSQRGRVGRVHRLAVEAVSMVRSKQGGNVRSKRDESRGVYLLLELLVDGI